MNNNVYVYYADTVTDNRILEKTNLRKLNVLVKITTIVNPIEDLFGSYRFKFQ